jgi:hypothetical protein
LGVGGRETAGEVSSGVISPSLKKLGCLGVCGCRSSLSLILLIGMSDVASVDDSAVLIIGSILERKLFIFLLF